MLLKHIKIIHSFLLSSLFSTNSTTGAIASNSIYSTIAPNSTTGAMASNSTNSTTGAIASNSIYSTIGAMASNPTTSTNEHIIEILPAGLTLPPSSLNDIAALEKGLIMCAVMLAVLEKVATGLGVVGFMVATVVLLGGLVTMLEMKDIVLVGLMLFIESIRIFCRIHYTVQMMMPIICFINSWLQLISTIIIGALSVMRLASQDFGNTEEANKKIRDIVLNLFYVVVLTEALVLLAKKAFFEWKLNYCELLKKVTNECRLELSDMVSIERFFNDAYFKSMTGNIFDAFKMNLITFAGELLVSNSDEEQLMGARILEALSTHDLLSDGALRKIGASPVVIERLIQMRTCNNIFGDKIRDSAAVILRKLAHKEPKVLGVAGMEEAMRSASTLLNSYHLD